MKIGSDKKMMKNIEYKWNYVPNNYLDWYKHPEKKPMIHMEIDNLTDIEGEKIVGFINQLNKHRGDSLE